MKHSKQIVAFILALVLVFAISGCQAEEKTPTFDEFIRQEFIDSMEADYSTMHFYLEQPEKMGVNPSKAQVGWGAAPVFDRSEDRAAYEEELKLFESFDRESLTKEQQVTYDVYKYLMDLNGKLLDEKFDGYTQYFSSSSGLQFTLTTNLTSWPLRNEQDVKDFVSVVKDTKNYVDGVLEYTRQQADKGLLSVDVQSVIDFCDDILETGMEGSTLEGMCDTVDAMQLGDTAKEDYKKQLSQAYEESVLPAYQAIRDTLEELFDKNNSEGMSKLPYGKEYYELLMQSATGSDMTVEEVRSMMEDAADEHFANLLMLYSESQGARDYVDTGALDTGFTSYEEILDYIEQAMTEDFPAVSDMEYVIFDLGEDVSDTGVAAYFVNPALDSTAPKQMRVNPNHGDIADIEVYNTVAHEGFPGHMYQFAYMYENITTPLMKLINIGGYTEGYAVYASYQASRYLEEKGIDAGALEAHKEYVTYLYALVVQLDIGIHYDGWSLETFEQKCDEIGLMAGEELYYQLQGDPCVFENYYVGYEQFRALREKAEDALGEKFTNIGFHEAILRNGIAPFSMVEKSVDEYIANAG